MKIPEQGKRLGGVILAIVGVVLLLRFVVLPSSLFSATPHQEATVVREMAKPVRFAGMPTCSNCHAEQYDTKLKAQHRTVGCETCHGASATHVADEKNKTLFPPKHREREFCLACHGFVSSRPNGFPQVDGEKHKAGKRCVACHDPHDPTPTDPPKDCGGCHGRIARIKDASTHSQIACADCHQVAPQHATDPRSALPSKPQKREACAQCHDSASKDPAAASVKRVDFKMHGRTFACWECHYAHLPEGPKK